MGKREQDLAKYLSKRSKKELTKQQHREMEENMTVDFNKVFITTQSTAKCELQQRKDVVNTKTTKTGTQKTCSDTGTMICY